MYKEVFLMCVRLRDISGGMYSKCYFIFNKKDLVKLLD